MQGQCKSNAEGIARRPVGESQSLLYAEMQPVLAFSNANILEGVYHKLYHPFEF